MQGEAERALRLPAAFPQNRPHLDADSSDSARHRRSSFNSRPEQDGDGSLAEGLLLAHFLRSASVRSPGTAVVAGMLALGRRREPA